MTLPNDTVCAPATSAGAGAISIIRVSGEDALGIVDKVVQFRNGTAADSKGYSVKFGTVRGDIDDVLVTIFRAPHSYTGEDGAEINCHASPYIVSRILELLTSAGAMMAGPGEFTRRAFVNGKMDLAQAEAVADLIASSSEASHRVARSQLKGAYSAELRNLRDKLLELAALLELELDFSEEDVEFADREKLRSLLEEASARTGRLVESFRTGNAVKNGVPVAIVGAVNSGKSTLMNALVGDDRAIVSDIAGTTRDTIEETMTLDGVLYRFIDTAGLRDTEDSIEKIGIERTLKAVERAEIIIEVLDSTKPGDPAMITEKCTTVFSRKELFPAECFHEMPNEVDADAFECNGGNINAHYPGEVTSFGNKRTLIRVSNKTDLSPALDGTIGISALNGQGLDKLRKRIAECTRGRLDNIDTLVTNLRHYEALTRAAEAMKAVRTGLDANLTPDLLAEDLRSAIHELNTIFGDSATIDFQSVTDLIFGRFCVGK